MSTFVVLVGELCELESEFELLESPRDEKHFSIEETLSKIQRELLHRPVEHWVDEEHCSHSPRVAVCTDVGLK